MTGEERERLIGWGVNGYGQKFYLCNQCGEKFGYVDYWQIKHKCKEVKIMNEKDKDHLKDLRDDIRWKIMRHESCSFKVDTGLELLGEPVKEFYYIRGYNAHDDIFEVDMTCLITHKISEIKLIEDDLIDLTNRMVL